MAVVFAVVGTMAVSFAVGLLGIPECHRQALRVSVMMIGLYCAIALRHVFV